MMMVVKAMMMVVKAVMMMMMSMMVMTEAEALVDTLRRFSTNGFDLSVGNVEIAFYCEIQHGIIHMDTFEWAITTVGLKTSESVEVSLKIGKRKEGRCLKEVSKVMFEGGFSSHAIAYPVNETLRNFISLQMLLETVNIH
ncbi:unnamed protein product [Toxocara canis]|uniref:Secreted protein n=1 Tax=Toxocara canis TaxID=6265 RepID=A0A183UGQ9_TOXCA|nr:unnamed protein product [Toxocara canis]